MKFFSSLKRAAEAASFRKKPLMLVDDDLWSICKKFGFFDRYYNPGGQGIANKIKLKKYNGDKVVIDWASGLMWQQGGSIKEMSFAEAKTWVEHFNQTVHAGFRDWRLPTLEEAMSLMEPKLKKGGLHIDSVFERDQLWIWTCDAIGDTSYAWAVNFRLGGCFCHLFNTYNYVRAVRCR